MPIIGGGGGGGAAGLTKLFSSTLGANAASIDTGAAAIGTGHGTLFIYIVARSAAAAAADNVKVTVNGDTGANYDASTLTANNTTVTGGNSAAAANWFPVVHGNGGGASYPGPVAIVIPGYDLTTFFKVGTMHFGMPDQTGTNDWLGVYTVGWRSTTAISQVTVTGNSVNLLAGSSLFIYGSQ